MSATLQQLAPAEAFEHLGLSVVYDDLARAFAFAPDVLSRFLRSGVDLDDERLSDVLTEAVYRFRSAGDALQGITAALRLLTQTCVSLQPSARNLQEHWVAVRRDLLADDLASGAGLDLRALDLVP